MSRIKFQEHRQDRDRGLTVVDYSLMIGFLSVIVVVASLAIDIFWRN